MLSVGNATANTAYDRRSAAKTSWSTSLKAWLWRRSCDAVGETMAARLWRQWHAPRSTLSMERCRCARCDVAKQRARTLRQVRGAFAEQQSRALDSAAKHSICYRVSANFFCGGDFENKIPRGKYGRARRVCPDNGTPTACCQECAAVLSFGT